MTVVLDASAVLAVVKGEAGFEKVIDKLNTAVLSSVNRAEVVSKMVDHGLPHDRAVLVLDELGVEVADFDAELADTVGQLRKATRTSGLSLGDRACLALAKRENATAITADRAWKRLDLGIEIELIR